MYNYSTDHETYASEWEQNDITFLTLSRYVSYSYLQAMIYRF